MIAVMIMYFMGITELVLLPNAIRIFVDSITSDTVLIVAEARRGDMH